MVSLSTLSLLSALTMGGNGVLPALNQATLNRPEQVRISYGEDPTRVVRVMWQMATELPSRVVEYGPTKQLGMTATASRPRYAYETGAIAEATLYNLKPNTTYFYRVGSPSAGAGWSEVREFRTADPNPREFKFTAFGDQGVSVDAARNVQNIIAEKPAFHVLLGDISYANGNQPVWDDYLRQIEPMTSQIPYMLALGNHENEDMKVDGKEQSIGYVSALARFALPGFEQWYTFDYGNARFVSINSDNLEHPAQLDWIDKTLAAARQDKRVKWVIVFQHHPLYGTSKGRGDRPDLIKALGPIYDRHKVDLVLCGHDHHYERQYPMRAGVITSKAKTGYKRGDGTLYMIQGGGGKGLYDFSDPIPEKCALREKTYGYLRVTVRRSGPLTIEGLRGDRTLIEKIDILE